MSKLASLKHALCEIAAIQNKLFNEYKFIKELEGIFETDGFVNDEQVPYWLVLLFQSLLNKKTIQKTPYEYDKAVYGDVSNLVAELEDLIQLKWTDEGERVEFVAEKLGMFGIISIEDDTYQVGLINYIN